MPAPELLDEARRVMTICNACRYCEGHCAVFPAMAMRLEFAAGDLNYLANLCHDCGACFHHCQYAPPHEFAVDVPRVFAEVRRQTWRDYAWPRFLAGAFERAGLAAGLVTAASLALVVLLTSLLVDPDALLARHTGAGAFYAVIPHQVMVAGFGAVSLFVLLALAIGVRRFWRDVEQGMAPFADRAALGQTLRDALTLRNLDGGSGDGCTWPTEAPSQARRWFHHLTFYGFVLCFASTTLATICHYALGSQAPYAWFHPVVVLGTVGGLGLLAGPAGLLWLKRQAGPGQGTDSAFAVLLFLTSMSGLVLLLLRATPAMGVLLAVHLGIVLGLFLVLPYSRFVHAVYRCAALLRHALERRRAQSVHQAASKGKGI